MSEREDLLLNIFKLCREAVFNFEEVRMMSERMYSILNRYR